MHCWLALVAECCPVLDSVEKKEVESFMVELVKVFPSNFLLLYKKKINEQIMMITSICQYFCADELRRVNYPTQVLFFTSSRETNKIAVKKEKNPQKIGARKKTVTLSTQQAITTRTSKRSVDEEVGWCM